MARLSAKELEASRAWLHDIFVWGGIYKGAPKRDAGYDYMYNSSDTRYYGNDVKLICDAILRREVNYKAFRNYDSAISQVHYLYFIPSLDKNYDGGAIRKKATTLARYIANFCAENNLFWNDSLTSTNEMDQIKETELGQALWEFNCFTSQEMPVIQAQSTGGTRTATPKAPGQPPQNGYKSSGPQSGNIINLVGQPNNKLTSASNINFCIEADKIGKNTPNAFVKPLDQKANKNGVNEVFMGSGNGYTDCKCWFDDIADAQNFLNQCQTKFGNKFTNIHISKAKADSNGYFVVKTEFGDCGIKASKMNEEVQEEKLEEKKITNAYSIQDIDTFDEAFRNYE